jgi:hypothetical protein
MRYIHDGIALWFQSPWPMAAVAASLVGVTRTVQFERFGPWVKASSVGAKFL